MAEQGESIIIKVDVDAKQVAEQLGAATREVQRLKQEQKQLTDALKEGSISDENYARAIAKSKAELEQATRKVKSHTAILQAHTIGEIKNTSSLDEQRRALNAAQKAYAALSDEARAAADREGGFREQIDRLSESVKAQEAAIGDNRRNVGNYTKSIEAAVPAFGRLNTGIQRVTDLAKLTPQAFKGMASGIGQATKAAVKFIATPIGAVLAAVAVAVKALSAIFGKLNDAISKNDDAGTALARLYEVTIQPIIDYTTKMFAKLADWIGKVAGQLADWIGGEDAAKAVNSIVVATDELQEAERQYVVNSAKRNKEIGELRDKAVQKDKYTAEERKKFMQDAIELQKKNLEDEKSLAAERLRIAQAEAERNKDTSDETKDRIAELQAAADNAEANYYSNTRRMNSQLTSFELELRSEQKAVVEARNKAREEELKQMEENAAKQAEIERKKQDILTDLQKTAEDVRVSLITDEGERAYQERKLAGEREIQALKDRLATDTLLTEDAKDALAGIIKGKEKKLQEDLAKIQEDNAKHLQDEELKSQMDLLNLRKETMRKGTKEYLDLSLQQLDLQFQQEIEKYPEQSEQRLLLEEQYQEAKKELRRKYAQAEIEEGLQTAETMFGQLQALNTAFNALQNAELNKFKQTQDEKKKVLEQSLKSGRISEEQYNKQVQALDEQTAQREKELEIEQAKREKAFGIMSAIINTAAAIMRIWAEVPKADFGVSTIALTALVSAVGAMQVAAIASEPLPQFEKGGVVGGNSYSGDKVIIRANSGEGVYTTPQANNILQEIANNPLRGGNGLEQMQVAMSNALSQMPAPVMVYKEFSQFTDRVSTYKEIAKV